MRYNVLECYMCYIDDYLVLVLTSINSLKRAGWSCPFLDYIYLLKRIVLYLNTTKYSKVLSKLFSFFFNLWYFISKQIVSINLEKI